MSFWHTIAEHQFDASCVKMRRVSECFFRLLISYYFLFYPYHTLIRAHILKGNLGATLPSVSLMRVEIKWLKYKISFGHTIAERQFDASCVGMFLPFFNSIQLYISSVPSFNYLMGTTSISQKVTWMPHCQASA